MTFTIHSECGIATIDADSVEDAKAQYERTFHYDFDDFDGYDGSWYWIDNEDGVRVEDHSECCP